MNNILKIISFFVISTSILLLSPKLVLAGCCDTQTGSWYESCCNDYPKENECCSLADYFGAACTDPLPCTSPGCDRGSGGGDDDEPVCEPTSCTLPACPSGSTSTDTGYLIGQLVSCDRGCGFTSYGNCYEEFPSPSCGDHCVSADVQFIPGTNQTNSLGYTAISTSGKENNNPVPVRARYYHSEDIAEMEAIYFWMAKTGITPTEIQYFGNSRTSGSVVSNDNYGFMVKKVDGQWKDIYIPYVGDKVYWVKVGEVGQDFYIDGPSGTHMVKVVDLNIAVSTYVESNFKLQFLHSDSGISPYGSVYEGQYNVYVMGNDVFGFTPRDNYTDPLILNNLPYASNQIRLYNRWTYGQQWIVDLTRPTIEQLTASIIGPTSISLYWAGADAQTYIAYSVGNAYRSRDDVVKNVSIRYPIDGSRYYTLSVRESDDVVGKLRTAGGEDILWETTIFGREATYGRAEQMNLGENRGGNVEFEVTVFDQGGNHISRPLSFRLGEWIATSGGFIYSQDGVHMDTRLLSTGLWQVVELFNKYHLSESTIDLSTELLSGNVSSFGDLRTLNHEDLNKSYSVKSFTGSYDKNAYQNYISRYAELSKENIVEITNTLFSGKLTDYCPGGSGNCNGKIMVVNATSDISIGEEFVCDTKGVFLVDGNVSINPNLTNSSDTAACVVIANGNITILGGTNHSSTEIGFDNIEGYFVAGGAIYISKEDKSIDEIHDGLFVQGGLVGLGTDTDSGSSVVIQRTLQLAGKSIYPVLNVISHPKYGKLVKELFGGDPLVFKTEIGFKPF